MKKQQPKKIRLGKRAFLVGNRTGRPRRWEAQARDRKTFLGMLQVEHDRWPEGHLIEGRRFQKD